MNNCCQKIICNNFEDTSISWLLKKFIIKQLTGVFRLADNTTRLARIWEKLLGTVLEQGRVAVIDVLGKDYVIDLINTYCDLNGDVIESDGYFAPYKVENRKYISLIAFDPIYFNLMNSIPLMMDFENLFNILNNAWQGVAVDINNSRIKFYYMPPPQFDDEQVKAHINVDLRINNVGIAIINNHLVYKQLTTDQETGQTKLTEVAKEKLRILSQNGLIQNVAKSDAVNVWMNFRNALSILFMLTGVRHEFSAKAAQMNVPETINVTSIFDIMENLWFERILEFVSRWNKKYNEKNIVIRRRISEDSAEETKICSTPNCGVKNIINKGEL